MRASEPIDAGYGPPPREGRDSTRLDLQRVTSFGFAVLDARIRALCRGRLQPADQDDLVQEGRKHLLQDSSFKRACERGARLEAAGIASVCALNAYRKFLRGQQRRTHAEHQAAFEKPQREPTSPLDRLIEAENTEESSHFIAGLPALERRILDMRLESDETIMGIAKTLNKDPDTIRSKLRKIFRLARIHGIVRDVRREGPG